MLEARDAFKVGFLARCVTDGLSTPQIVKQAERAATLLEKQAAGVLGTALGKVMDTGSSVLGGLAGYGIPVAAVAPWVAGGLGGYGLAKATDIDDTDVQDIKDHEVLAEYRRQAARLRRQRAVRDYYKARQQTGRVFL